MSSIFSSHNESGRGSGSSPNLPNPRVPNLGEASFQEICRVCSARAKETTATKSDLEGLGVDLLPLPDVRQKTEYTCGTAALRSVFGYFGLRTGGEAKLAARLHTTEKSGTHPEAIVRIGREAGLKVSLHTGWTIEQLAESTRAGSPVIVAYQAYQLEGSTVPWEREWSCGHYAVVIGVDADRVYLQDPSIRGKISVIGRDLFLARWHDVDGTDQSRWEQLAIVFEPPSES